MATLSLTYNGEKWVQSILIVNPLYPYEPKGVELDIGFVQQILLSNCLYRYSPKLTIQYNDINYRLLNLIQLGTTYVYIQLRNDTKEEALTTEGIAHDKNEINCAFLIDDIQILYQDKGGAIISINCVHSNIIPLCKKANYATNKSKGPSSPLRIIQDILKSVNYDLNKNYVEVDKLIDFTSVVGQRVNQAVDYLLRQAITPKTPPSYLYHNIMNNQGMIYNRQLIPDNIIRDENVLFIYAEEGIEQIKERNIISEIKCQSLLSGTYMYDQYARYIFHNYDHLKRKWTQDVFNPNDVIKLMTDGLLEKNHDNTEYTTDLYYETNKNKLNLTGDFRSDRRYEFPNQNYIYMYDYLKDLELFSSTISFKARGEIVRDVGQIIRIESKNAGAQTFCGGLWTITEIVHNWQNGMYINEILCHRTVRERYKDLNKDVFEL